MSTHEEPAPRPAPRRPRRAVRQSGTVGTDESVLRSRHPAPSAPADAPGASRAGSGVAPGAAGATGAGAPTDGTGAPAPSTGSAATDADPWSAVRSADDSDRGWGREEPASNDDRLQRERPPHW